MIDRIPTPGQEGRVLVTPEDGGAPFYAKIQMADNPTQNGDPLSKSTLLKDATADAFGLKNTAVPDDVFFILSASAQVKTEKEAVQVSGKNWIAMTVPYAPWSDVAYGEDRFVAIGGSANYNVAAYSLDGISWTSATLPYKCSTAQLAYGAGKFVGLVQNYLDLGFVYSADGTSWGHGKFPLTTYWKTIAYGNGVFVAISSYNNVSARPENERAAAYSADGVIWTMTKMPVEAEWTSVAFGEGRFVAVSASSDGQASNIAAYSVDGVTWAQSTLPEAKAWNTIAYGDGKFVTIAYDGSCVAYSEDGVTWEKVSLSLGASKVQKIAYGDGKFIAVCYGSRVVLSSNDGINWTSETMPDVANYNGLAFGDRKFVALAQSASTGYYSESVYQETSYLFDVLGNSLKKIANCARFETGSYTGTGTSGASNPNSLTFDFVPKMLIVTGKWGGSNGATEMSMIFASTQTGYVAENAKGNAVGTIAFSANTVSWFSSVTANAQGNVYESTYHYIAIG